MPPRRQAAKRAAAAKAKKAAQAVVEEKETADTSEKTSVEETPVTETPVTETPVTETPVTETPVTEEPVIEEPVTETSVTETPVTETSVTETPVTETPVTEEPVEQTAEVEEETTDVHVQAEDGSELMQGIEEALSGHEPTAEDMVDEVGDNVLAAETENIAEGEEVVVGEDAGNDNAEMCDAEIASTVETDAVGENAANDSAEMDDAEMDDSEMASKDETDADGGDAGNDSAEMDGTEMGDAEMGDAEMASMVETEAVREDAAIDGISNFCEIDKTPMDEAEMASKIATDGYVAVTKDGKMWPYPEGKIPPWKGRILRARSVMMKDIFSRAAAPILQASFGYIIASHKGGNRDTSSHTSSMDAPVMLEIGFNSEEEADEMFVRICNLQWKGQGKPARVLKMNHGNVDYHLSKWSKDIAQQGRYDGRSLFVNGIPPNTTVDDLKALFDNVRWIQIPTDEEGNQQGYALVEFYTRADAVEGSKKKLKMQENQLVLHTIGMSRIPRSKAAQDRLDQEMKQIKHRLTQSPQGERNKQAGKQQNQGQKQDSKAAVRRNRRGHKKRGQNQHDGNHQNQHGKQHDAQRKRLLSGGNGGSGGSGGSQDKASPRKRGRFSSGSMGGDMHQRQGQHGGRPTLRSIKGELRGQIHNLEHGGRANPQYLMNLARMIQEVQKSN